MVKRAVSKSRRILYIEGANIESADQQSEFRQAISALLKKAGVGRKPRVVACGGRAQAYRRFCNGLANGQDAYLLVDAEEVVTQTLSIEKLEEHDGPERVVGADPWAHVAQRQGDGWARPAGATDDQLHFMTVTMETWLLSDRDALTQVINRLDVSRLPPEGASLEQVDKHKVNQALKAASRDTKAGAYGKGAHSFKVLALVSPEKLRALLWARRFLDEMMSA